MRNIHLLQKQLDCLNNLKSSNKLFKEGYVHSLGNFKSFKEFVLSLKNNEKASLYYLVDIKLSDIPITHGMVLVLQYDPLIILCYDEPRNIYLGTLWNYTEELFLKKL